VTPDRVGAVVNPAAGSGGAASLFADLAQCFPDATVEASITTGPADVHDATIDQARWADLVAVIGGDGTVREAAAALIEAGLRTPLFVVPAGRGNSTYRHLYGGRDWREIARGCTGGVDTVSLEVGRIGTTPTIERQYFVLGFTAGLFRSAIETAETLRGLPGPLAYLLATVGAAVIDDPVQVTLDVDGNRLFSGVARLVAIGGGRYRGSDFELLPDSRPGDETLHALVVEPTGVADTGRLLRLARAGRVTDHPAVSYRAGESATIDADGGVPVEVDGTPVPAPVGSARVTIVPNAVTVAYPAEDRDLAASKSA
jgi:diacylglycerol kinase (ATP)